MHWLPMVLVVLGSSCTQIYDAQLSDRRDELEENRSVFLPPEDRVQFKIGAKTRLFWVGLTIPLNENELRSFDGASEVEPLTYEFDLPMSGLEDKLVVGDELIVICNSSGAKNAFDAALPNQEIGTPLTEFQGGRCAVSGNTVYIVTGDNLVRWIPSTGAAEIVVDLSTTGIGPGSIAGFAVDGDRMVFLEGGRLYLLDLNNPAVATWLENDSPPEGNVVINERGVLYRTGQVRGAFFVSLPDRTVINLHDQVETGGYRLNRLHDGIHLVDDRLENTLFGDQVIYRADGGIFAYGIDTRKVQDILLDSEDVRYFDPVVLETGQLYVEQRSGASPTVFTVQLNEVLR